MDEPRLPRLYQGCLKRWIGPNSEYWPRSVGPKCGGRIRHPRQTTPAVGKPARAEVGEDQLELFVIVKVASR